MELNDRLSGSVPYARAFALTLGGHYHLKAALADPDGPRAKLAAVFLARQMAAVPGLLTEAEQGGSDLYTLSPDDLAA
jgi:acyl-CoA dehydrogenase